MDADGDLDIVINNLAGPARLFENRLCSGDHPQMDLRWPAANRYALGTPIQLDTATGIYVRGRRASVRRRAARALRRPASQSAAGVPYRLALELARHGITVNCTAPGFIKTDTVQPIIDLMQSPQSPYTYTRTTPLGPGPPPATSATWRSSWLPTRAVSSPAPPSLPTAASSPTDPHNSFATLEPNNKYGNVVR